MNKINDKTKRFMIFGIIILVIVITGATLAYYIWSSGEQIKISTTVGGAYVYFDGGSSIENATLRPVSDKKEGITKNISMRADAAGVTANLYLDLVTLPDSLKDVSFRYAIYNGSTLTKEGNFSSTSLASSTSSCTVNSTTHITLLSNISVPTTKVTYTLYIWIDGANYTNPKSMMNQVFSFKLHADGTGAILNNEYELTNSDGSTYTPTYSGSGTKAVRSSAPLSKFKEVKVDDATVDSSNYTLTEGSTIVTFKESYLKSLSVGDHTFKIVLTDGITEGKITIKKLLSVVQTITNLYNNASKTTVTNNGITYNYATSVSLMNDRLGGTTTSLDGGNIRYYGASPNNYIYFNCSDYSNQSSSTCEIWRIIGVFNNKVKLIRNESIGSIAYDDDTEDTYLQSIANNKKGSLVIPLTYDNNDENIVVQFIAGSIGDGQNDYSVSSLQKILNNYYYNGLTYTGTSTYDFTSTGFKNDTTRNMVAEITYNLGGHDSSSVYPNQMYEYERGTTVYTGSSTTWAGKIALAYPSDYGYSVDLSKCDQNLYNYDNSACTSNNWMKIIINNEGWNESWLLTPNSGDYMYAWYVNVSSDVNNSVTVYSKSMVAPVLHLNSELSIKSGTGSSSDPYQLNV